MKDFLGNELQVGDSVVAVELRYRNLLKCTVVALTTKMVRLLPIGTRDDPYNPNHGTFLQLPSQIILSPHPWN